MIDTLPGEHPFSVLTMGKNVLKAANKVVGYINNEPLSQGQLVGAVTEMGMAATGTNFARAAAAGGAKAGKGGLSIFGSFVEDPSLSAVFKKRTAVADAMEAKGIPPQQIYKDVGLFRDHDKEWRFEVSDKNAKIKPELDLFDPASHSLGVPVDKVMNLEDVLDHAELFKVWPGLKDQPIKFTADSTSNYHGMFNPETGEIEINIASFAGSEDMNSTLLHELQHAIQSEEFMRGVRSGGTGANPEVVMPLIMETFAEVQGRFTGLKTDEEIINALKNEGLDDVFDVEEIQDTVKAVRSLQKTFKFMDDYLKQRYGNKITMSKAASKTAPGDDPLLTLITDMDNTGLVTTDEIRGQFDEMSHLMYRGDRGEVEAKVTESRKNLSKEERRRFFPEALGADRADEVQDFNALQRYVDSLTGTPNLRPENFPSLKNKS